MVHETAGTVVLSKDDCTNGAHGGRYVLESDCIADGCYTLTFYDRVADGICCYPSIIYGYGWYKVCVNGESATLNGNYRY